MNGPIQPEVRVELDKAVEILEKAHTDMRFSGRTAWPVVRAALAEKSSVTVDDYAKLVEKFEKHL